MDRESSLSESTQRQGRFLRLSGIADSGIDTGSDKNNLYSGICMIVASAFRTDIRLMFAPTRCRADTALARQVAVYLAHVVGSKSYTEIGRVFGRDRTTAAHACRLVEDRRDDPVFDTMVEQLEAAVKNWLMFACDRPSGSSA